MRKRSLWSRRDAIRMKMRNAVSREAEARGRVLAEQADDGVDLVDVAVDLAAGAGWSPGRASDPPSA